MLLLTIDDKYTTMPWDEIDAVVFDVGRVLLDFQPETILKRYLPDCPALHPVLLKRMFQSPYWVMQDHGVITRDECVQAMSGGNEAIQSPIRTVLDQWIEMEDVIGEGVAAMKLCRAMGKKVYILSNYDDFAFAHIEKKYDFIREADERFVSSRLHMMKPDQRLYRHVQEATGHAPERMLFIDDAPANVMGAMLCGWQGLCFNEAGKLSRFFTA